jgi:two-component system response regulator MprA
MRILVTDDEPDIRITSTALLVELGHEVRSAGNGIEALECAAQWAPQIVLIDLNMPGMDGFLATRKLRAVDSTPRLIIACSAHVQDPLTYALARAAGCDECLTKPVDWDRLQALIAEFERKHPGSPAR